MARNYKVFDEYDKCVEVMCGLSNSKREISDEVMCDLLEVNNSDEYEFKDVVLAPLIVLYADKLYIGFPVIRCFTDLTCAWKLWSLVSMYLCDVDDYTMEYVIAFKLDENTFYDYDDFTYKKMFGSRTDIALRNFAKMILDFRKHDEVDNYYFHVYFTCLKNLYPVELFNLYMSEFDSCSSLVFSEKREHSNVVDLNHARKMRKRLENITDTFV
jgi:hypothetical protein